MNTQGIIGFIPVRGGSKSIPWKNIKKLNGRPLLYWVIDAALKCRYLEKLIISTDSELIREKVFQYKSANIASNKLKCIGRSSATATDTASTESAMLEYARNYPFKHIVLIQATSPLLTANDLEQAIDKYFAGQYDSLLSLVRQKRFIWQENGQIVFPENYDPGKRPRRQDFTGILVENGAFYISSRQLLLETESRISGKTGYYEMPAETYYEIDEPGDWIIVEDLLKRKSKEDGNLIGEKAAHIKLLAMDCDGVLTDGGMYYSEDGHELKKFNTRDGMAIRILQERGIKTAIISGENTPIIKKRAEKLGIDYICTGVRDKVQAMQDILLKSGLAFETVAYIGDDINDIDLLNRVRLSFSVQDGIMEVKELVDYVTRAKGGQGAVREVAELLTRK
jgi:N-acylneuraminate cytidylyltransferase